MFTKFATILKLIMRLEACRQLPKVLEGQSASKTKHQVTDCKLKRKKICWIDLYPTMASDLKK